MGKADKLALQKFLGMLIKLHPEAESSFSSSGVIQPLSNPVTSSNQQLVARNAHSSAGKQHQCLLNLRFQAWALDSGQEKGLVTLQ